MVKRRSECPVPKHYKKIKDHIYNQIPIFNPDLIPYDFHPYTQPCYVKLYDCFKYPNIDNYRDMGLPANENLMTSNDFMHLIRNISATQTLESLTITLFLNENIKPYQTTVCILKFTCIVSIKDSTWRYTYPHTVNIIESSFKYLENEHAFIVHIVKEAPQIWTVPTEILHLSNSASCYESTISPNKQLLNGHIPESYCNYSIDDNPNNSFSLNNRLLQNENDKNTDENLTLMPNLMTSIPQSTDENIETIPKMKIQWFERDSCLGLTLFIKNCTSADWELWPVPNGSQNSFASPASPKSDLTPNKNKNILSKTEFCKPVSNTISNILKVRIEKFDKPADLNNFLKLYCFSINTNGQHVSNSVHKINNSNCCNAKNKGNLSALATPNRIYEFNIPLPGRIEPSTVKMSFFRENIKLNFDKDVSFATCWNLKTVPHVVENFDMNYNCFDDDPDSIHCNSNYNNLPTESNFVKSSSFMPSAPSNYIKPLFSIGSQSLTSLASSQNVANSPTLTSSRPIPLTYNGPLSSSNNSENFSMQNLINTPTNVPAYKRGYCGLTNLGNTCFMNCVIQILSNTHNLRDYFMNGDYRPELNTDNPLGLNGELACAFADLLNELWSGTHAAVSPFKLKSLIAMKANQFLGYSQHDAQEFLAFLLDGLHEDLNRVKNKPYTAEIQTEGRTDTEIASETWNYYMSRNDSYVNELFLGQYKSLLTCPECKTKSTTFDPLLYMTLPLPEKSQPVSIYYFGIDDATLVCQRPIKFVFRMAYDSKISAVADRIEAHTKKSAKNISFIECEQGSSNNIKRLDFNDNILTPIHATNNGNCNIHQPLTTYSHHSNSQIGNSTNAMSGFEARRRKILAFQAPESVPGQAIRPILVLQKLIQDPSTIPTCLNKPEPTRVRLTQINGAFESQPMLDFDHSNGFNGLSELDTIQLSPIKCDNSDVDMFNNKNNGDGDKESIIIEDNSEDCRKGMTMASATTHHSDSLQINGSPKQHSNSYTNIQSHSRKGYCGGNSNHLKMDKFNAASESQHLCTDLNDSLNNGINDEFPTSSDGYVLPPQLAISPYHDTLTDPLSSKPTQEEDAAVEVKILSVITHKEMTSNTSDFPNNSTKNNVAIGYPFLIHLPTVDDRISLRQIRNIVQPLACMSMEYTLVDATKIDFANNTSAMETLQPASHSTSTNNPSDIICGNKSSPINDTNKYLNSNQKPSTDSINTITVNSTPDSAFNSNIDKSIKNNNNNANVISRPGLKGGVTPLILQTPLLERNNGPPSNPSINADHHQIQNQSTLSLQCNIDNNSGNINNNTVVNNGLLMSANPYFIGDTHKDNLSVGLSVDRISQDLGKRLCESTNTHNQNVNNIVNTNNSINNIDNNVKVEKVLPTLRESQLSSRTSSPLVSPTSSFHRNFPGYKSPSSDFDEYFCQNSAEVSNHYKHLSNLETCKTLDTLSSVVSSFDSLEGSNLGQFDIEGNNYDRVNDGEEHLSTMETNIFQKAQILTVDQKTGHKTRVIDTKFQKDSLKYFKPNKSEKFSFGHHLDDNASNNAKYLYNKRSPLDIINSALVEMSRKHNLNLVNGDNNGADQENDRVLQYFDRTVDNVAHTPLEMGPTESENDSFHDMEIELNAPNSAEAKIVDSNSHNGQKDSPAPFYISLKDESGSINYKNGYEKDKYVDITDVDQITLHWSPTIIVHNSPKNAPSGDKNTSSNSIGLTYEINQKELERTTHKCEDGCCTQLRFRNISECSNLDANHLEALEERENTLHNCLKLFSKKEILTPEEAWYCPNCKKHTQAEKTMSLWKFPKILVIIFKRFAYGSQYWREKLDKLITFPLENLDLSDVYEGPSSQKPVYDLYGVINHQGTLQGGHYTSYARITSALNLNHSTTTNDNKEESKENSDSQTKNKQDSCCQLGWRYFDDSSVTDVYNISSIISPASYVLFYKLRE